MILRRRQTPAFRPEIVEGLIFAGQPEQVFNVKHAQYNQSAGARRYIRREFKMNKFILVLVIFALTVVFSIRDVLAGPPLTSLEGKGGIAFNPIAYLADSDGEDSHLKAGETDVIGKPRFGIWYVNLDHVDVDWTAIGVADTFFKRLEVSYGQETIAQSNQPTTHKNSIGSKFLLVPENSFDSKLTPAVSVGTLYKNTSNPGSGADSSGFDYYLVGTKLVTQLPRPVLISGGILSTKGRTTGVFGFDKKSDEVGFGNIDVIFPHDIVLGFEYEQGAKFSSFKNADYWDAHIAWLANENLSLVLAYVDAGNSKSTKKTGLGDGVALSVQYAF